MVDECPHRGAPLSAGQIVADTIECAYHGYRFGPDGSVSIPALGADAAIPPKACVVTAFDVTIRYGLVWLAPAEPVTGIIVVPVGRPALRRRSLPDQTWHVGAGQMTENFLDMGHLAFLHAKTFSDPDAIEVPHYTVERDGWGFVCDTTHSAKSLPTRPAPTTTPPAIAASTWWYAAPFALRLRIEYHVDDVADDRVLPSAGRPRHHQGVRVRPAQRHPRRQLHRRSRARWRSRWRSAPRTRRSSNACAARLFTPLDLQAEVHTPADRSPTVEDAGHPRRSSSRKARVTAVGARLRSVAPIAVRLVVIVVVWTIGGRAGRAKGMIVTPRRALSPITGDSRQVYWRATKSTVWAAFRGLLIGGTLAFLAALLAAAIPGLRRSITRLAAIANAAPAGRRGALSDRDARVRQGPIAVAALAVFFFVFMSASVGLWCGATCGARHVQRTGHRTPAAGGGRCSLPAMWPSLLDGIKLAAPAALAGTIFGEWYGADRGLGVLLIAGMQGGSRSAEQLWAASLLAPPAA